MYLGPLLPSNHTKVNWWSSGEKGVPSAIFRLFRKGGHFWSFENHSLHQQTYSFLSLSERNWTARTERKESYYYETGWLFKHSTESPRSKKFFVLPKCNSMEINDLLQIAIDGKASDMHIVPHYYPTLRINNGLLALREFGILTGRGHREASYSSS